MNKQIVAGFIGNNITLRYLSSRDAVLELNIGTTCSWKKQEAWHSETEWHHCIFYREKAEAAAQHLKKGDAIYIEGRTYTRRWEAQDKSKRSRKEIIVELFMPIRYEKKLHDAKADNAANSKRSSLPIDDDMAGVDY